MALECAICLDVLINPQDHNNANENDDEDGELMEEPDRTPVLTRCGHMYHRNCLAVWMASHGNPRGGSCPQCREKLTRRQLTVMDFPGQRDATEKVKPKVCTATKPTGVENEEPGSGNNGKCFDKDAHEKLSKEYEALLETYRQKKDELALISGEKASLQALLASQQSQQGTKRKNVVVDDSDTWRKRRQ